MIGKRVDISIKNLFQIDVFAECSPLFKAGHSVILCFTLFRITFILSPVRGIWNLLIFSVLHFLNSYMWLTINCDINLMNSFWAESK